MNGNQMTYLLARKKHQMFEIYPEGEVGGGGWEKEWEKRMLKLQFD